MVDKFQVPSTKFLNKFQLISNKEDPRTEAPITQDRLWSFGHCDLYFPWDLEVGAYLVLGPDAYSHESGRDPAAAGEFGAWNLENYLIAKRSNK